MKKYTNGKSLLLSLIAVMLLWLSADICLPDKAEAFVQYWNGPTTVTNLPVGAPPPFRGTTIVANGNVGAMFNMPSITSGKIFTIVCPYKPSSDPKLNVFIPSSQVSNVALLSAGKGEIDTQPGLTPINAYWFVFEVTNGRAFQIMLTNSAGNNNTGYFVLATGNYASSDSPLSAIFGVLNKTGNGEAIQKFSEAGQKAMEMAMKKGLKAVRQEAQVDLSRVASDAESAIVDATGEEAAAEMVETAELVDTGADIVGMVTDLLAGIFDL